VWTNLLDNALDAVGERGVLTIAVRPDSAGGGVTVEVGDDGPGIPNEIAARVFDPFFTTKDVGRGTGLGLHLSRAIVARHGGILELVSNSPGATVFRVTLPLFIPAGAASGPGVVSGDGAASGGGPDDEGASAAVGRDRDQARDPGP
jgi:signal transduction histidine kinase